MKALNVPRLHHGKEQLLNLGEMIWEFQIKDLALLHPQSPKI
jgi:Cu/Ag efflux protein CusF